MAGKLENTTSIGSHTFDKDLNKDVNDFHLPNNSWVHARNAINNSKTGDLGKIGNEPANEFCTETPYTIIGAIHLESDTWAIFSTNNTKSEIGLFFESTCEYFTAVNDDCLNFNTKFLIKGTSRATANCVFEVYWDDSNNNSRYITLSTDPLLNPSTNPNSPLPWVQVVNPLNIPPCNDLINTPVLDCSKLRVAKLIIPPCVILKKGVSGGTIMNGSYIVFIAYAIQGQKVSDWYMSNIQSLFEHENDASSLDVEVESMDTRYDEVIVTLLSVVNQQTVARQAGIYSTRQTRYSFDVIQNDWISIPIEQLPIMTPIPDKSDAMYNTGPYLIRVGPTSKEDFNYQPLANQIVTKWVAVEYPSKYYRDGGSNTEYLRDEVYPYFVRWVYDTGDRSNSYHIPGRPASPVTGDLNGPGPNALPGETFRWQTENTAYKINSTTINLPDGGVQVAEGYMSYWESVERYPDDSPQVWDSNIAVSPYNGAALGTISGTTHNLCGKPIRHHKFPQEVVNYPAQSFAQTQLYNSVNDKIILMGVKFENVKAPLMNDGVTPVPGVIGYEILRGSRNGNKSIIAKGMINNMGQYTIQGGGANNKTGLYPNYPYNDLASDPFLATAQVTRTTTFTGGLNNETGYSGNQQTLFSAFAHTFHSPETSFTNPFLDPKEIQIYGNICGNVIGKFEFSENHPKEKMITNTALFISAIAGVGIAALALGGKRTTTTKAPSNPGHSKDDWVPYADLFVPGLVWPGAAPGVITGTIVKASTPVITSPSVTHVSQVIAAELALKNIADGYEISRLALADIGTYLIGLTPDSNPANVPYSTMQGLNNTVYTGALGALASGGYEIHREDGHNKLVPGAIGSTNMLPTFSHYFTEGTDSFLELLRAVMKYQNFVLRYHSHGFYNLFYPSNNGVRAAITAANYIGPQLADFASQYRINNVNRSRTVAIEIGAGLVPPAIRDRTRYKVSDIANPNFVKKPTEYVIGSTTGYVSVAGPGGLGDQTCSSHYVGLKQRMQNQYGQLTNIKQLLIPGCMIPKGTENSSVPVMFGGDTYIGRFTEKNTFFYFNDWLYGQPDGAQLDYNEHKMFSGLFPRFWANFNEFETTDFTSSIFSGVFGNLASPANWFTGAITPNDFYNLDGMDGWNSTIAIRLAIKNCWMYLFNSGVRDFFVESEINIDLRDWGNSEAERHYDPYRYADTKPIFNTAIIKAGNYFKYDFSLSVSKLFLNYVSWGTTQNRSYDPFLAETCYIYRPRRVIYSLPSQFEGRRDNWLIFLPNNYYDFLDRVTCIKPINKSGAVIFFDSASPVEFQGTDQLQTALGTKLTIGDGGLFSQPLQALTNADRPYEYASCQDRLSVINTPAGVFWMSQNQGKIFNISGGIKEISNQDLKWWFASYLPYKLTQLFPSFTVIDNPVIGIGCQSIYDNQNGLAYFCKKDYILKPGYTPSLKENDGGNVQYKSGTTFIYLPTGLEIELGNPQFFEDASWTVSYDVKTGGWLGWHDWHPELLIPGKNTFMTTITDPTSKKAGIWIHNQRCDLYCNYYNKDYPFEIEYMTNNPQEVTTLRSIEYHMEAYKYDQNCYDRFHVLDYNFDEMVVYNTEQCSGMLRLTPNPRPDPLLMIQYPRINPLNPTFIEILYSKVENKYRINQFWDITDDRGEYPLYPLPPVAQRMIWNTGANGYVKALNAVNLNYSKEQLQRKKFRHYTNSVFLRKRVIVGQSIRYKMLVLISNNKELKSPR